MRLLLVTGLSGAGKSQALRAVEDMGYFCVDNLPPSMLPDLVRFFREQGNDSKLAVGVDVRAGDFFGDIPGVLRQLKETGVCYEILFLDAGKDTLIRRYKETRRLHPLQHEGSLEEAIAEESRLTMPLREAADYTIDTSLMLVRQLKERLFALLNDAGDYDGEKALHVSVMSFGYKYGIPAEADIVYDARFIPNPFHVPELKEHNGKEQAVRDYVLSSEESGVFLRETLHLLEYLIPRYRKEGKNDLVIAVGCTGGMHRSVVMAEEINAHFRKLGQRISVTHRDIEKDRLNR